MYALDRLRDTRKAVSSQDWPPQTFPLPGFAEREAANAGVLTAIELIDSAEGAAQVRANRGTPGYADVFSTGDPTADISAIENIVGIWQAGVRIR